MLLNRIKDTLRNFAGNTTLHGIDRVSSRKHFIGKVLWACIVLTCVSTCFIQIYTLGVQYASKPVNTKISVQNQKLYFPAVSFCNLNPISFLKMQEGSSFFAVLLYQSFLKTIDESSARKKRDVQRKFEDSQDTINDLLLNPINDLMSDGNSCIYYRTFHYSSSVNNHNYNLFVIASDSEWYSNPQIAIITTAIVNIPKSNSTSIYATEDLDILSMFNRNERFRMVLFRLFEKLVNNDMKEEALVKLLFADFSEFVIHCKFEGRQCNESMFVPFLDKYYGQCYRFPSKPTITTRAGPLFALQLLINVNQSDYVPYTASEAGLRLSIHEHGSRPFLENNGFSVATGFRTDVSLSQKRIERMPGTKLCDTSNEFSSISACFDECVEKSVEQKCWCWLNDADIKPGVPFCLDDEALDCEMNARGNVTGCKCNNPCSEKQHIKTIHTSRWPAKNYEVFLDKILKRKGLSNTSDSLLQVNIYFSSLYEEVTEEILSFTFENFLSNIGGLLGLWIGMSAISIGELIELCFFLLRSVTRRNRVVENHTGVSLNEIGETTDHNITQSVHIDMSIVDEMESGL